MRTIRRFRAASAIAVIGCAGGCGGGGSHPDAASSNPRTLWLAPDGSEIRLKLTDSEPPPF